MIDGTSYERLRVSTSASGAVVELVFDHGKANEMGSAELTELERLASELSTDPDARALISTSRKVSSRGTPIFVAGANVTERVGWSEGEVLAHVRRQRAALAALRRVPVLHVCVVGGVAFGWGTEWLLTADYRVAVPGARFALPETGLGIVPGAGGTAWMADEIGLAHALRLGMTGEQVLPDEALRLGLVQELAADLEAGLVRARALALATATRSPTAVAAFKAAALAGRGRSEREREALEDAAYEVCVRSGEAAVGRARFSVKEGDDVPPWGERAAGYAVGSEDT